MYKYNYYDKYATIKVNGKKILKNYYNSKIIYGKPQREEEHYDENNIEEFMQHYWHLGNYYINNKKLKSFDFNIKNIPIEGIEIIVSFDYEPKENISINDILNHNDVYMSLGYLLERKIKIEEILKQK